MQIRSILSLAGSTRSLGEVRLQLFTDRPLPMLRPDAEDLPLSEPLAHFAEHGYARLGPVLEGEGAARLAARADVLMMSDTPHPGIFYQHDADSGSYADLQFNAGWVGPSPRYRKLERLELEPLFMSWVGNALFKRIARGLLEEPIRLYRAVLWNKAPGGSMAVPWHQDDGKFWGLNRAPFLQIWTALDDAPVESGCLEVLPGSHAGGLASPEGGTVSEACLARAGAERRALPLPALRGESIMVHNHTWHRTLENRTPTPRRAISVSFLGADTHCIRRRKEPREFKRLFADE